MLLANAPVPVPSVVLVVRAVVGLAAMLQQIPLTVTSAPPSKVTLPPLMAVVIATPYAAVVVTAGTVATVRVVNDWSEPYEVPIEFVAYALA